MPNSHIMLLGVLRAQANCSVQTVGRTLLAGHAVYTESAENAAQDEHAIGGGAVALACGSGISVSGGCVKCASVTPLSLTAVSHLPKICMTRTGSTQRLHFREGAQFHQTVFHHLDIEFGMNNRRCRAVSFH